MTPEQIKAVYMEVIAAMNKMPAGSQAYGHITKAAALLYDAYAAPHETEVHRKGHSE